MKRQLVLLVMLGALSACTSPAPLVQTPQTPAEPPHNMLWVGNSFYYYNNSMHGHVGKLLQAAGLKGHHNVSATISGSGLNWHDVEAHFKGSVAIRPSMDNERWHHCNFNCQIPPCGG